MSIVQFPSSPTPSPRDPIRFRTGEDRQAPLSGVQTAILNCIPAHIAILDHQGSIVVVNDLWRRFAAENGDRSGVHVGRNYLEVCRVAAAAGDENALRALRSIMGVLSGELTGFEMEYPCHSAAEQRWFQLIVIPMAITGGAVTVHRDVTKEKLAHAALEHARDAAESVSRAKNQFVANMSHEIRTPLQGVIGMLDLTLGTGLSGEQRAYLRTARSAAEALMLVLNDVLDFSRIESGKLALQPVVFSLRAFLTETLTPLRQEALQKKVRFETFVDSDVPDSLVADADRLRQILSNLAGNAVKFTDAGEIAVRVQREKVPGEKVQGDDVQLCFTIADTGIGIPPEKQDRIFEPFSQVDGSCTRRHGGNGLGLTIAAQLVRLMEGRISLESRDGKGSTFRFTVRLRAARESDRRGLPTASQRPAESAAVPRPHPLRILVVDDSRFSVLFTTEALSRQGHTVAVANSGPEALAAVAEQSFDLIVMDVQMPEMDGFQTTAEIKARERERGGHVPVLAMTAHATPENRDACLRAGMDGYICKPVTVDTLLRAVAELVPPEPARTAAPGGLDRETLLAEVGGDVNLLRRLAGIFAQETERRLSELRRATAAGNAVGVRETAHALKGMIGHWGKGKAFESARRLEDRGSVGDPADVAAADGLAREISVLLEELRQLLQQEAP